LASEESAANEKVKESVINSNVEDIYTYMSNA